MPLRDGDETREAFVDAVVALGEEWIWWRLSREVSIPFMGASGEMYTWAGWEVNSVIIEFERCSDICGETMSIGETATGCIGIARALGSWVRISGGYMDEADGDRWVA